ncbi:hypothetical protein CC1G_09084 [Coprinopsis cinerea okayama7|uniref:Uncharacterized protein n=1 Tax=Coprinopsis cinerea (strain Okayama-7 / 130 / ATCC MYA-4618 / FGSC 9003) TaxID=240176 RepID=A8P327_COPC7|nr:hypothetical protein CC1G_09084 [Coprinopsis cinerea okayama7\|eukprot:XP_001838456.2 hypothetical protein CC1G_09084 [Coprinopsis cinerea okayama7\
MSMDHRTPSVTHRRQLSQQSYLSFIPRPSSPLTYPPLSLDSPAHVPVPFSLDIIHDFRASSTSFEFYGNGAGKGEEEEECEGEYRDEHEEGSVQEEEEAPFHGLGQNLSTTSIERTNKSLPPIPQPRALRRRKAIDTPYRPRPLTSTLASSRRPPSPSISSPDSANNRLSRLWLLSRRRERIELETRWGLVQHGDEGEVEFVDLDDDFPIHGDEGNVAQLEGTVDMEDEEDEDELDFDALRRREGERDRPSSPVASILDDEDSDEDEDGFEDAPRGGGANVEVGRGWLNGGWRRVKGFTAKGCLIKRTVTSLSNSSSNSSSESQSNEARSRSRSGERTTFQSRLS